VVSPLLREFSRRWNVVLARHAIFAGHSLSSAISSRQPYRQRAGAELYF
jgi:hypothetical protein